jgi:hypothetical protein
VVKRKWGAPYATKRDFQPAKQHNTSSGQNQNQYTAALILYVVQNTHLHVAEHKFKEKDLSYKEAGSMHTAGFSAKIFRSFYIMNNWQNIFCFVRSKRIENKIVKAYEIEHMHYTYGVHKKRSSRTLVRNGNYFTERIKLKWIGMRINCCEKE